MIKIDTQLKHDLEVRLDQVQETFSMLSGLITKKSKK